MHLGFSTYTGMFVAPTGTLTIDPKNPSAAKVDITFPIAKVVTTATGLDEHLQNADFFDAAKYPTGRFVSTRVTIANQTAQIDGTLTLKGATRPVTLDAQFVGAGNGQIAPPNASVGFAATTATQPSDLGISPGIPPVPAAAALERK